MGSEALPRTPQHGYDDGSLPTTPTSNLQAEPSLRPSVSLSQVPVPAAFHHDDVLGWGHLAPPPAHCIAGGQLACVLGGGGGVIHPSGASL